MEKQELITECEQRLTDAKNYLDVNNPGAADIALRDVADMILLELKPKEPEEEETQTQNMGD